MSDDDKLIGDIHLTLDNGKPEQLLTGQEWYDRFEKELDKVEISKIVAHTPLNTVILEVAKKAAGISND